ncbi:MAG TPA: transporter, partial [Planctomycetota bacterium]|nr:transporter [Planctomycetota bacterium]
PVGIGVLAVGGVYMTGDLAFGPVLRIEGADVDLRTGSFTFTHDFAIAERTARVDLFVPVQAGRWDGIVDGVSTAATRDGLADPAVGRSLRR